MLYTPQLHLNTRASTAQGRLHAGLPAGLPNEAGHHLAGGPACALRNRSSTAGPWRSPVPWLPCGFSLPAGTSRKATGAPMKAICLGWRPRLQRAQVRGRSRRGTQTGSACCRPGSWGARPAARPCPRPAPWGQAPAQAAPPVGSRKPAVGAHCMRLSRTAQGQGAGCACAGTPGANDRWGCSVHAHVQLGCHKAQPCVVSPLCAAREAHRGVLHQALGLQARIHLLGNGLNILLDGVVAAQAPACRALHPAWRTQACSRAGIRSCGGNESSQGI